MSVDAVKALIVDDEALGRQRVQQLLADENDVQICAMIEDGPSALEWLKHHQVDVIFLDIQMPEMDGFEFLSQYRLHLAEQPLPMVVFVTAYHEYAIQAFRVHALDYLLKPLERKVFKQSLNRVREHLASKQSLSYQNRISALLDEQSPGAQFKQRYLTVKQGDRFQLVQYADIFAVETQGNYLSIQLANTDYKIRETLQHFLQKASHQPLVQINRSTAVNLELIKEIQSYFKGEYVLILHNGLEVITSAKYRTNVQQLIS